MNTMNEWPKPGDKLIYDNPLEHFWFTNVIENCNKLILGQIYTVRECHPASSWVQIKLEEVPGQGVHGDDWFSLSSFTRLENKDKPKDKKIKKNYLI